MGADVLAEARFVLFCSDYSFRACMLLEPIAQLGRQPSTHRIEDKDMETKFAAHDRRLRCRIKACAREDIAMEEITGDMKVAEVIRRWPETAAVFASRGCGDIHGRLARLMTVRSEARMYGIELAPLLEELNRAARHAPTRQA